MAEAFKYGRVGRFQLEAAVQSVHAERARSGRTEWAAIVLFFEQLMRISPVLGTRTGLAPLMSWVPALSIPPMFEAWPI